MKPDRTGPAPAGRDIELIGPRASARPGCSANTGVAVYETAQIQSLKCIWGSLYRFFCFRFETKQRFHREAWVCLRITCKGCEGVVDFYDAYDEHSIRMSIVRKLRMAQRPLRF